MFIRLSCIMLLMTSLLCCFPCIRLLMTSLLCFFPCVALLMTSLLCFVCVQTDTEGLLSMSPGSSPRSHRKQHRRYVSDTSTLKLPDPNRQSAFRSVHSSQVTIQMIPALIRPCNNVLVLKQIVRQGIEADATERLVKV